MCRAASLAIFKERRTDKYYKETVEVNDFSLLLDMTGFIQVGIDSRASWIVSETIGCAGKTRKSRAPKLYVVIVA